MNTKDEPDVSHDNFIKQANAIIDVTKNLNDERRDSSNQESDNKTVIEHKFSPKTTVNALSCSFCNKIFNRTSRKQELEKHERTHTGEKPFKCDLCDKYFATSSNRCDHVRKKHIGIKPHSCDICDKGFWRKDELTMHRISAHKDRYTSTEIDEIKESVGMLSCYVCNKLFWRRLELEIHERVHTGDKPFKCDVCEHFFSQRGHLDLHMKRHLGLKPYPCDVCGKEFLQKYQMIIHKRIHTKEKPFSCDVCGKSFSENYTMQVHKRRHTEQPTLACEFCEKAFYEKYSLQIHRRIHTGEKPFSCTFCGKAFRQRGLWRDHTNLHKKKKGFSCDLCDKVFLLPANLSKHKQNDHSIRETFSCSICKQEFDDNDKLKQHRRIHLQRNKVSANKVKDNINVIKKEEIVEVKEEPNDESDAEPSILIECKSGEGWEEDNQYVELCTTMHSEIDQLNKESNEEVIDLDVAKLSCTLCGRTFARKDALIYHTAALHSTDRPFSCEICSKSFAVNRQLMRHRKTHTEAADEGVSIKTFAKESTHIMPRKPAGNYQFQCQQCDKNFPRRANLNNHIARIHSTDKPFSCNICSKPFALVKQLKRHIKIHTKDTYSSTKEDKKFALLSCNVCDVMFADKETLDAHRLTHKGDNELINLKEEEEDDLVYDTVQVPLQQNSISQNKVNNKINVIQKVEAKAEPNDDSDIEDVEPSISIENEGGGREEDAEPSISKESEGGGREEDAEPSILMECEDGEGLEEED